MSAVVTGVTTVPVPGAAASFLNGFSFSGSEPEMRIARKFAETWLSKGFNSDNVPRELNTDYCGFGKDVEYLAKHSFVFPYTNVKNDYSVYEEAVDSFDSFISDETASQFTRP